MRIAGIGSRVWMPRTSVTTSVRIQQQRVHAMWCVHKRLLLHLAILNSSSTGGAPRAGWRLFGRKQVARRLLTTQGVVPKKNFLHSSAMLTCWFTGHLLYAAHSMRAVRVLRIRGRCPKRESSGHGQIIWLGGRNWRAIWPAGAKPPCPPNCLNCAP